MRRPRGGRNLAAFDPFLAEDGLRDGIDWPFIDWGFLKEEGAIIRYLKAHILDCFPNNPLAPRLSDPDANNSRLINYLEAAKQHSAMLSRASTPR
ncbi:MAG: hypothetical protein WC003_05935 [Terrimicrobiaceae bacterium]